MALPDDLLTQARHLVSLDRRRPKQANLRRAVSAAYYALFHLLASESARRISPVVPASLVLHLRRAFDHATMRHVCSAMLDSRSRLRSVFALTPSVDLILVADSFHRLQDARHEADYDVSTALDRGEATLSVQSAEGAFAAWKRVRNTDEANIFLLALLMKKDWPRS